MFSLYHVPEWMLDEAWKRLDADLRQDFRQIMDTWFTRDKNIPESPEILPAMKADIVWKEASRR